MNDGVGVLVGSADSKLDHGGSLCGRQGCPCCLSIEDLADFHDQVAWICSGADIDDGKAEVDVANTVSCRNPSVIERSHRA